MGLGRIYLVLFFVLITYTKESFPYVSYSDFYFNRIRNDENNALCVGNPVPVPPEMTNVNDVLEIQSCFNNKESYAWSSRGMQPTPEENLRFIYGDIDICNCLRDKAIKNPILGQLLARGAKPSDKTKLDSLPKNYEKNFNNAIQENGKVLFDASIICQENVQCLELWISKSPVHALFNEQSKSSPLISNSESEKSDVNEEARKIYEKYYDNESRDKIKNEGNKFAQSLLEESAPAEGQCVFGREFIAFKQKESFEKVSKALSDLDLNNFNPEDWDFRKLMAKYNSLMANSPSFKEKNKEQIELLKNKMIFLNYNPMVKTFLTIDPISNEELNSKKNVSNQFASRRGVTQDFYELEKLNKKKIELLGTLKSYVGTSKTGCSIHGCLGNVLDEKKLKQFNNSLKDFFIRPDIGRATKWQSNRLAKDLLFQHRSVSDNDLPLTQQAIVEAHLQDHPGMHPDDCSSKGADIKSCPEIYGGYCKKIDSIKSKVFVGVKDSVPDDLEMILTNSFNTDIKTNPDFHAFNKKICDSKFKIKNKSEITFNEYKASHCKKSTMIECRSEFFVKKVKDPLTSDIKNFITFQKGAKLSFTKNVAEMLSRSHNSISGDGGGSSLEWMNVRNEEGLSEISKDDYFAYDEVSEENFILDGSSPIGPAKEDGTFADQKNPSKEDPAQAPFTFNPDYSAASSSASSIDDKKTDKQKIENMTDDKKKNLLSDLENDYEDWRKTKNLSDTNQLSPADSAKDSLYKKEIETLRALLDEQRKLTETQSKLLNDAISRKNADLSPSSDQKPIVPREKFSQYSNTFGHNSSASFSNNSNLDGDSSSRNPASFSEAGKLSNLSSGGSAFKNSSNSGGSSRRTSAENSDSLAREQAKLVNVKSFSDGSILVEPNSTSAPNAITLSVSDEQYKVLLVNPTGLSLNQIEKSIPVDQIGKLEKSGEIILLLKNGSNPPFEVKVERKQNKLVYSLKDKNGNDQKPVRRVFTRKALENELKVQR